MVEVVLVEARDLVAKDWGGTSDPYVSARYGNIKKHTKVSCTSIRVCCLSNFALRSMCVHCYVSGVLF